MYKFITHYSFQLFFLQKGLMDNMLVSVSVSVSVSVLENLHACSDLAPIIRMVRMPFSIVSQQVTENVLSQTYTLCSFYAIFFSIKNFSLPPDSTCQNQRSAVSHCLSLLLANYNIFYINPKNSI